MWLFTVASLRYSWPAISALDRPWAACRTTSSSRWLNLGRLGSGAIRRARGKNPRPGGG